MTKLTTKLDNVENNLLDALNEIERAWRANPSGEFKHARRFIIDALWELGHENLSYEFDATKKENELN